jgi:multimeric flavodoxin WrbA
MTTSLAFIIGTSRADGNTWHLVDAVNKDIRAEVFDLSQLDISYFDYQHRNLSDDFVKTIEELLQFETFGFVSPMYWYTVSAQMKTFIDRLSDLLGPRKDLGRRLRGKRTFLLATGSTEERLTAGMEEPIKLTSSYLGMNYRGAFYARFVDDLQTDPQTLRGATDFVKCAAGNMAG